MGFHASWNGVKGHLGGGGQPPLRARFEAAAIRGAPVGLVARCGRTRKLAGPTRALRALPAGAAGGARAGRCWCPRGGSGPRRAQAAVRRAAGSGQQRAQAAAVAVAAALGSGRAAPAVPRARSHTRSHTHTYTRPRTHSHTLRRAHAARRPEGGGSARLGGGGSGSVLGGRAGGLAGGPRSPAPRLGAARAAPALGPAPGGRPAPCPAAAAEQRAAAGGSEEPGGSRRRGDHVPGPGGGQPR